MSDRLTQTPERGGEKSFKQKLMAAVNIPVQTPEYRALVQSGVSHTEALSRIAPDLLDNQDSPLADDEKAVFSTVSLIGGFIEGEQRAKTIRQSLADIRRSDVRHSPINKDRTQKLKDELYELKSERLVPFNHSLKELINTEPSLDMADLIMGLRSAHSHLFGRYHVLQGGKKRDPQDAFRETEVISQIQNVTEGMAHELAFETVASAAGIEFKHEVTADDDINGTDIIVYINNREIKTDIKKNESAEYHSHINAVEHNDISNAVWDTLSREDFTGPKGVRPGSLTIPFSVAQQHADALRTRILDMESGALTQYHLDRQSKINARAGQAARRLVR